MLGGVPLKWIDPATWPWFVYLWIVVIFSSWLKPAWRWLQRQRSANWPIAEGHIESVAVTELKVFSIRSRSSPFGAELGYSYSIAGSPQAGWYSRDFPTEQEAAAFLRDLKGKSIAVRYNPNKPSMSELSEPSLDMLLRNRGPVFDAEAFNAANTLETASRHPFLWALMWIAAVGLVVSLWVHVGAVMGRRVAPEAFFWILHVGIFIVWFPAVISAMNLLGNINQRDFWKVAFKGSPEWMRYMVYGFFGYAVVNFMLFMTKVPSGNNGANPPAVVWRGFSGHWMAFYAAAMAILYSAARVKNNGWHCSNGHSAPASARFCGRCGQQVIRGFKG